MRTRRAAPRALLGLLAALVTGLGCTITPDVSSFAPREASDCAGQKVCGYRCVGLLDPATGCSGGACSPCPAAAAGTVAVCSPAGACDVACAPGLAASDGVPAHGCSVAVGGDTANCGAPGHACEAGQACTGGLCDPGTAVASTGAAPRGLALTPSSIAWTTDAPVNGGVPFAGTLHRAPIAGGAEGPSATGLGHASWVRSDTTEDVAVAGTEPLTAGPLSFLVTAAPATRTLGGGQSVGYFITGLGLTPAFHLTVIQGPNADPALVNCFLEYERRDGAYQGGGVLHIGSGVGGNDALLHGLGSGAGFWWLGSEVGVSRVRVDGAADVVETVAGGGIYFAGLAEKPVPHRVAARPGPTAADPLEVYFADLTDGSIWTGRTTGSPPTGPLPWRVVRGPGPRAQMDLAADEKGVVWSDLDAGQIWALPPGGQPYLLATGRPWAIALTPTRVYWTDVDARAIRWVAR